MIRVYIGKQRKGKSTLAYHDARLEGKPVVIFDPRNQFDFRNRGGSVSYGQGEFEDAIDRGQFPAVMRLGGFWTPKEVFEDFCEVALDRRGLAVIIDEARYLMRAQAIDENLSVLLRAYGQQEHSLYITAHRMVHVHDDVAEPADTIAFFGTRHPRSLERIADFTRQDVADAVRALEGRDFLLWSDAAENFVIQRDASSWKEQISPQKPEAVRQAAA